MRTLDDSTATLTPLEKRVINGLQAGFPVCARPFAEAAKQIGTDEQTLIDTIEGLMNRNIATRFGPLFDIEKIGGIFCLCVISTPPDDWQETADYLNGLPEVAHNYLRDHEFNLWFVLATETEEQLAEILSTIENQTGFPVLALPKEKEYFIGLKFELQS